MKNFVLIGAAGYIAPRHMAAIKATNNKLIAAYDPCDSVGIMDSYFPEADFFTEFERFDRHIENLKRQGISIDYVSVCSPNYLHDAHIRFGLRIEANVICEKPIVLNPWNLEALIELEKEYHGNVYNILQLRLHKSVIELKKRIDSTPSDRIYDIDLQYITSRGKWYNYSWKGDISKSGGITTNIGIHFFDMLLWIFGDAIDSKVSINDKSIAKGSLKLQQANVNWILSTEYKYIPEKVKETGMRTYRSITIDNEEFEFSGGFMELHNSSYSHILAGEGFRITEAQKAIDLVYKLRNLA